jgi:hypothetical protein
VVGRFLQAGAALAVVFCVMTNASGAAAMGKAPPTSIGDQLAEYRRVLLAYFKAFNLLPIILPADQKPGDVFDMRQKGVLKARAAECFPGLAQPAAVRSALAYTFELDSTNSGLALGLPEIGSINLGGDFDRTVTVSYTDVTVATVSQEALSAAVSASCKDVVAIVKQSETPLGTGTPPPLLAVVGTVVSAKREVFIGTGKSLNLTASVDKLGQLLEATGIGASLRIVGLDPNMSVALGFGGKQGVLIQSDQELPVAFMPAFIPEVIFSNLQGAEGRPSPQSLRWQSFDPNSTQSTKLLGSLIDAAVAN